MEDVDEAKKRRSEARERRRSMMTEPFETLNESSDGTSGRDAAVEAAKRAAGKAAAAALAGALGGALKALADRRKKAHPHADRGRDEADREPEEAEDASPGRAAETDEVIDNDPQTAQADAEPDRDVSEHKAAANGSRHGRASQADVAQIVSRAKSQLHDLLGEEAEGVSGVERSNGGWSVTLEVVEIRRIPDSTDVLASYEVVLDDDGEVVRFNRKRRYRRTQVEELG